MIRTSTVILLLILFTACSFGQTETYSGTFFGNIVRVDMNSDKVDYADTLGQWYFVVTNGYIDSSRGYFGHIKVGENEYFLISEESGTVDNPKTNLYLEDASNNRTKYSLCENKINEGVFVGGRIENLQFLKTENGVWIILKNLSGSFISNDGIFSNAHITTNTGKNLILQDILGKVGDNYISAFFDAVDSSKYYYFLVNLDNPPNIYAAQENMITFSDSAEPVKIALLKDDLYIVKRFDSYKLYTDIYWDWFLEIYRLNGLRFDFVRKLDEIGSIWRETFWTFNDKSLVNINAWCTYYSFNDTDTTFHLYKGDNEEISPKIFDVSLKYGAELVDDYIYLYDMEKGDTFNLIYMNGKSDSHCHFNYYALIDSPYIYIYQDLQKIGVADDINENLTYKLSAYPNPFNPQTTIAFTIPNAGKVELAVYDLLGRKVTELLNEYRDKGSYEVKFNGANLASGIYFYTIRAGNFIKTEKLMLLK